MKRSHWGEYLLYVQPCRESPFRAENDSSRSHGRWPRTFGERKRATQPRAEVGRQGPARTNELPDGEAAGPRTGDPPQDATSRSRLGVFTGGTGHARSKVDAIRGQSDGMNGWNRKGGLRAMAL